VNALLTTIAAALVLALAAALVGPYFVDWTAYRADFEAKASQVMGAPVHVKGPVEARLLPHPSISFSDVEVGRAGEPGHLEAKSFSMRIFPAPLLRGEVHVRDVDVESPRLTAEMGPDGEISLPLDAAILSTVDPARVTLERIGITNGEISIEDPEVDRAYEIVGINGTGAASSLAGPFKFEGQAVHQGGVYGIKLATGRVLEQRVQTRLEVSALGYDRDLLLDGQFSFGGMRPAYSGRVLLTQKAVAGRETWQLNATAKADARSWRFDDLALQLGPDDRALHLEGFGDVALGARPEGELTLTARQLDLDRLLGPATTPRRPRDVFTSLTARLDAPDFLSRMTMALKADGILVAQELVQDVDLVVSADPSGGLRIRKAQARFPGDSRAALTGDLVWAEDTPSFKGRAETDVRDWPLLARWLGLAESLPGVRSIGFLGEVDASPARVALSNARLSLDGERAEGRLVWERRGDEPASLSADVTASKLDLDALDLAGLSKVTGGSSGFDLGLKVDALRYAGVDARNVAVNLQSKGGDLIVRRFAMDDIGGAKVDVSGDLDIRSGAVKGMLTGRISARELDGLGALLRKTPLPPAVVEGFTARAAALEPMDAEVVFGADPEHAGGVLFRTKGTAGGSRVDARFVLDAPTAEAAIEAEATIVSSNANRLLQQIGFPVVALEAGGEGKLVFAATGLLAKRVETRLEVDLLGTTFAAEGDLTMRAGQVQGTLQSSLASADINEILSRLGRMPPAAVDERPLTLDARMILGRDGLDLDDIEGMIDGRSIGGRLGFAGKGWRTVSGDLSLARLDLTEAMALGLGPLALDGTAQAGPWPAGPVSPGPFEGFVGRIALALEEARLPSLPPLTQAKALMTLAPGAVGLEQVSGDLAGGRLEGSLGLANVEQGLSLKANVSAKGLDAAAVVWRNEDEAVAEGRLDVSFDLQGAGSTIAAAVANAAGGGTITLRDATLRGMDPDAFGRIRAAAADAGLDLQPASVAQRFARETAKGRLSVQEATGAFSIATGTLRLSNVAVDAAEASVAATATVDLGALRITSAISVGPRQIDGVEASALPRATFSFNGDLADPRRDLDVTALTSFLTAEAIDREVGRINQLEEAARERARLRREMDARDQERRAEQERQRAEARQAEKERLARQAPDLPPPLIISPQPGAAPFGMAPQEGQGPLVLTPRPAQPQLPAR
jgi:uncharacterized protein involved in outer membrane biogenesis